MNAAASEIVMPRMGLTMESGTVIQWLKREGETVQAGEPLLEIETDKATVEIEAMDSGVLGKITAGPGEERQVGEVIGYLFKEGAALDHIGEAPPAVGAASSTMAAPARQDGDGKGPHQRDIEGTEKKFQGGKVKASPAARRLAQRLELDLSHVQGSGPGGRVVAWNVEAAAAARTAQPGGRVSPVAQRVASDLGVDLAGVRGSGPGGTITRRDVEQAAAAPSPAATGSRPASSPIPAPEIEPFTRIQRLVAERMTHSFGSAPHFYLHVEVDGRGLVSLRQQLLNRLEQREGVHLTYTDLLVHFCARLLPRHPLVMAQWTPDGLQKFTRPHIGIAVDTDNGLLVPVLRDADRLGLAEIARQRAGLAERARLGKLLPQEFEEGVFTISNLGVYRIDAFEAILNPPQAAILAVGRIKERALVENGQVVPAAMLNLSLSVDHRVLDGGRAARFLSELAEMIEAPGLALA